MQQRIKETVLEQSKLEENLRCDVVRLETALEEERSSRREESAELRVHIDEANLLVQGLRTELRVEKGGRAKVLSE